MTIQPGLKNDVSERESQKLSDLQPKKLPQFSIHTHLFNFLSVKMSVLFFMVQNLTSRPDEILFSKFRC